MAKPAGPTIPRWQLGEELVRLRRAAKFSEANVAERLGCSESKIKKVEAGYVGANRAELMVMLDMFDAPQALRDNLMELQKLGRQRGWWSTFGQLPAPFATFLGLEGAATEIKAFESIVVHGLLQTEDYARALALTCNVDVTEEQAERQVRLRMERRERVLESDEPPKIWVVLDEAALHRVIGGPAVMRAQLDYLVEVSAHVTLQVVPFGHGGYPGTLGAFTLFDFAEAVHTPVVYVEGQAGNLYMERDVDLRRCNIAYNHMVAAALSPPESAKLITAVARTMV